MVCDISIGFANIGEGENYEKVDRTVHKLILKLRHLVDVWKDVLPVNVFNKSIGMCAVESVNRYSIITGILISVWLIVLNLSLTNYLRNFADILPN